MSAAIIILLLYATIACTDTDGWR